MYGRNLIKHLDRADDSHFYTEYILQLYMDLIKGTGLVILRTTILTVKFCLILAQVYKLCF